MKKLYVMLILVLGMVGAASAGITSVNPSTWNFGDSVGFDYSVASSSFDASNALNGTFQGETLHDGTINGASWTTGKYGDALSFDGNEDVNAGSALNNMPEVTLSTWFKTSQTSTGDIIRKQGSLEHGIYLENSNLKSQLVIDGNLYALSTSDYNVGEWELATVTYDGSTMRLYVDGVEKASRSVSGSIDSSTSDLKFANGNLGGFEGDLDDIRIYNRSLSSSEVSAIYENNTFYRQDLEGYWRMDHGQGSTAYDTHHRISRYNSNNRNGDAVSFDGSDGRIEVTASELDDFENGLTITGWVNPNEVENNNPIFQNDGFGSYYFIFKNNGLAWGVRDENGDLTELPSNSNIPTNEWSHVTAKWNGTHQKIYIDGSKDSQTEGSNNISSDADTKYIGGRGFGNEYNGTYDDIRVYNRSLSSSEISDIYQNDKAIQEDLVAWYTFDNATGKYADSRGSNVLDYDIIPSVKLDVLEDGSQIVDDAYLTLENWYDVYSSHSYSISDAFSIDKTNVYYNATLSAVDKAGSAVQVFENQFIQNSAPNIDTATLTPSTPLKYNEQPDLDYQFSDSNGDINNRRVTVKEDGNKIVDKTLQTNSGTINNLFTVDEANVFYNVTVTINDTGGASDTAEINQFIQDNPPNVQINKPKNNTYGTTKPSYSYKAPKDNDDNPGETLTCKLKAPSTFKTQTITEGSGNHTGTLPTQSQGTNSFTAKCTENQGISNTNKETVNYEIDTQSPQINVTAPLSNNQTFTGLPLNYTVTDPNLNTSTCEYSKDAGTRFTINNCQNTTINYGSTGIHNLTVYASDTAGNEGSDTKTFKLDSNNAVKAKNADTGSSILNFEVTITNGTDTIGATVTDGDFEYLTSKMPKGKVNITVKSSGFETTNTTLSNVDSSFSQNTTVQMPTAGFTFSVFDEKTNQKIQEPVVVTINTDNSKKTLGIGNKYISDKNLGNAVKAFDGDTGSGTDQKIDFGNEDIQITGTIPVKSGSNTVSIRYTCHEDINKPVKVYNTNTDKWEEIGRIQTANGETRTATNQYSFNNDAGQYDGRIRLGPENENFCKIYEVWQDNYDTAQYDINQVPKGDAKITLDDIKFYNKYNERTYRATIDQFSSTKIKAYLLKTGEGIRTNIEAVNQQLQSVTNADVAVQRSINNVFQTVAQKRTSLDGTTSFKLDPSAEYRAVVTHPKYSTFEGSFNPANYQFDPLQIVLGNKNRFNFTTRWNSLDVKMKPFTDTVNQTGTKFNFTVVDSENNVQAFGVKLYNDKGNLLAQKSISNQPSGSTVNLAYNFSNSTTRVKAVGFIMTDGETYNYTKNYLVIQPFTSLKYGLPYAINKFEATTSSMIQHMLALLVTVFTGGALGRQFNQKGGGIIVLTVLGAFTLIQFVNPFIFTITAVATVAATLLR